MCDYPLVLDFIWGEKDNGYFNGSPYRECSKYGYERKEAPGSFFCTVHHDNGSCYSLFDRCQCGKSKSVKRGFCYECSKIMYYAEGPFCRIDTKTNCVVCGRKKLKAIGCPAHAIIPNSKGGYICTETFATEKCPYKDTKSNWCGLYRELSFLCEDEICKEAYKHFENCTWKTKSKFWRLEEAMYIAKYAIYIGKKSKKEVKKWQTRMFEKKLTGPVLD